MLELNFKVHWNKYTPFKLKRITRFFPVLLFVSVEPTWVCLSFDFRHVDDHSCQCIISYDISVTPFFPCMPFAKTGPDTMHFCYLPLVVNSTLLQHDIGLMKKWNAFVLVRRDAKLFKENNVSMRNVKKRVTVCSCHHLLRYYLLRPQSGTSHVYSNHRRLF